MPPKAKFNRNEIIDTALCITREQGIEAVTARELGNRLGSSARPIFTVFNSMDEVKELVILKSKELYGQYVEEGLNQETAFKGVGIAYIRFAIEQPKLFQLLFMMPVEGNKDISMILPVIDDNYDKILKSVQGPYCLEKQAAENIYQHLWTYTHGIATMIATGICHYTMEQISENLTYVFKGLLLYEKKGKSTS